MVFLMAMGVIPSNPVYGSAEKLIFMKHFAAVRMKDQKVDNKKGFMVTCDEGENGAFQRFKTELEKMNIEVKHLTTEDEKKVYQLVKKGE